jgi:ribosomal protein S18 acetylase RimI-like enzyme
MTIVPADTIELAELAALFSAGYAGYYVPVHVDEAAFALMVDAWDIDLRRSCVALDGNERVGVALLGTRGERGWIGGLGVVPGARRTGIGRALMEAVLAGAPADVSLEVIEQNERAIPLYTSLGFERTRILEVWSLTGDPRPATARTVEARPLGQSGLPWQRADASLPSDYERLEVEGAAALIRSTGPRVSVLQLSARDETAAEELLSAARARGESLHYVNVPEGDPASAALESLGGRLDLRQFEMRTVVSA